jgi:diguanylate cyclase (GGDEF)-like protein
LQSVRNPLGPEVLRVITLDHFVRVLKDSSDIALGKRMHRLTLAAAMTVAAAAILLIAIVGWSAQRSDQISKSRQLHMAASALAREIQKIPYDQESMAVWDDSVNNVRNAFSEKWTDVNLGVWMWTYFKHDRSYVLNADDRVLYAMAEGKKITGDADALPPAIMKLVRDLREQIGQGALDLFESGKTRIPRAVDFAVVEGHPSVISVMPLVPHSSAVSQARGTECLIVGVRFLDTSFTAALESRYLLEGARFTLADKVKPDELSLPVNAKDKTFVGNLVWTPELPGRSILHEVLPFLILGLGAVAVALFYVLRRLRRAFAELIVSEEQSRHLAYHDALTGLPNRAFLVERLNKALSDLPGHDEALALLFLDLDRFKQVNDTLGHATGDELISHLALMFSEALPEDAFIARMGGDEFAILKTNLSNPDELRDICENLLKVASGSFNTLGKKAMVGLSIGVAIAPSDGLDQSELLRKADIALYQAKFKGGQQFQFFSEDMGKQLIARHEREAELRCALEKGGELEVTYQPFFASTDLRICGVESLVRWNHPRYGQIAPFDFIGIAEESGLIGQLGEWVLRESCRAAKDWDIETVAVNVSPIQLSYPEFPETVMSILHEVGLPPNKLELEITESALLDNSNAIGRNAIKSLREAGVRFALDDFGTGYSSLNNLIALEVDRVKIDRSFVEPSSSRSVVWAIVNMAHAIGLQVTAEGVESENQKDFLRAIGCNHLQGFVLSRPVSEKDFAALIKKQKDRADDAAAA